MTELDRTLCGDLARTDEFWLNNITVLVTDVWPIQEWIDEMTSLTADDDRVRVFILDEAHLVYDGGQYFSDRKHGVNTLEMQELLNGSDTSVIRFLQAEGQLCRAMLTTGKHSVRWSLCYAWMMLTWRFVRGRPFAELKNRMSLVQRSLPIVTCCTSSRYMFDAYEKLAKSRLRYEGAWLYVFRTVDCLRELHFGDYAYDCRLCPLHLNECGEVGRLPPVDTSGCTTTEEDSDSEYV